VLRVKQHTAWIAETPMKTARYMQTDRKRPFMSRCRTTAGIIFQRRSQSVTGDLLEGMAQCAMISPRKCIAPQDGGPGVLRIRRWLVHERFLWARCAGPRAIHHFRLAAGVNRDRSTRNGGNGGQQIHHEGGNPHSLVVAERSVGSQKARKKNVAKAVC
jgi:hypothetical protein